MSLCMDLELTGPWYSRNLITARVQESNAVVGLEAGYLIQDTLLSAVRTLPKGWRIRLASRFGLSEAHRTTVLLATGQCLVARDAFHAQ